MPTSLLEALEWRRLPRPPPLSRLLTPPSGLEPPRPHHRVRTPEPASSCWCQVEAVACGVTAALLWRRLGPGVDSCRRRPPLCCTPHPRYVHTPYRHAAPLATAAGDSLCATGAVAAVCVCRPGHRWPAVRRRPPPLPACRHRRASMPPLSRRRPMHGVECGPALLLLPWCRPCSGMRE